PENTAVIFFSVDCQHFCFVPIPILLSVYFQRSILAAVRSALLSVLDPAGSPCIRTAFFFPVSPCFLSPVSYPPVSFPDAVFHSFFPPLLFLELSVQMMFKSRRFVCGFFAMVWFVRPESA
ncbi:hypothetical protein, partial [uncultured Allobaculum sp.]|uniref:hypothetical protein n=1 Tax=uncultured Allobaculum sp. TaxID=1187017 RepID=UPI0026EE66B3